MNGLAKYLLGMVSGAAIGAAVMAGAATTTETDPVKLSPEYYSVRIDNDRVRVLEYRLQPGQKEPMHGHPPGVVYTINAAQFRSIAWDGTVTDTSSKPGGISWRDTMAHATENVGSTEAHSIAVELKPCKP